MTTVVAKRSIPDVLNGSLRLAQRRTAVLLATWRFVYVFFSNGTPFDAPNRSETCPSI